MNRLMLERLEVQSQLRQISKMALPNRGFNIFPRKSQRDVTPQMIEDYKLSQPKPKFLKPDFELKIDNIDIPNPDAKKEDIQDLEDSRNKNAQNIAEFQNELMDLKRTDKKTDEDYSEAISKTADEEEKRKIQVKYKKNKEQTKTDIEQTEKNIEEEIGFFKAAQAEIENIKAQLKENEKSKFETLKKNRYEIKRYEDTLKLLNRGYMLQQGRDETDEEYADRMTQLQEEDSVLEQQIKQKNVDDFKRNILELYPTLPLYIVEKLYKKIDKEQSYEIGKRFPEVKRKFIETFGTNPNFKNLYEEMYEFLDNVFIEGLQDILEEQITDFSEGDKKIIDIDYTIIEKGDIDAKIATLSKIELGEEIKTQLGTSKVSIRINSRQNPTKFKVLTQPKKEQLQRILTDLQKTRGMTGKGIVRDIPRIAQFGEIMINPHSLFYKNKVVLRNKLNTNIYGFRDRVVSDELRDNLLSVYNKNQPIHRLTDEDQIIYDAIITKANLERDAPSDKKNSIEKLKRRMNLLEGSLSAGNDNVKKEILDTLKQLVNLEALGEKQAMNYYKGL
jgi:hypothetical protein